MTLWDLGKGEIILYSHWVFPVAGPGTWWHISPCAHYTFAWLLSSCPPGTGSSFGTGSSERGGNFPSWPYLCSPSGLLRTSYWLKKRDKLGTERRPYAMGQEGWETQKHWPMQVVCMHPALLAQLVAGDSQGRSCVVATNLGTHCCWRRYQPVWGVPCPTLLCAEPSWTPPLRNSQTPQSGSQRAGSQPSSCWAPLLPQSLCTKSPGSNTQDTTCSGVTWLSYSRLRQRPENKQSRQLCAAFSVYKSGLAATVCLHECL